MKRTGAISRWGRGGRRLGVLLAAGAGLLAATLSQRAGRADLTPAPERPRVSPAQEVGQGKQREYEAAALAAAQHPRDPKLAVEAGGLAGDLGRHVVALRWFKKAAALNPRLLPAITGQGQMWAALGWPGRAAKSYERALKLAPDEPELLRELARAYTELRDLDRALEYAKRAQAKQPGGAAAYRTLETVYEERLEREPSIQAARRACDLGRTDPQNWVMLGQRLLRSSRSSEGESALRTALRLDPADSAANITLARALTAERKTPAADREAFALLARARLKDPLDPLVLFLQGEIAVRAAQLPLGISLLRQAREGAPEDPETLRALAQALTRAGRMEEGLRLAAESQKLGPRGVVFPDLENNAKRAPDAANTETLAGVYRRQGRLDSAIWVLERGLRRSPGAPNLRISLARVRAEAKKLLPRGLED